jgi:cytochrome c-type biogenesis protein CcmH/NrfG
MVQKVSKKQLKQRIFILFSGLMFIGSLGASTLALYTDSSKATVTTAPVEESNTLEAQVEGYKLVLQREPDNQTALEGLANTYLQMNNPEAAIAPLEKLVTLNPDRPDYTLQLVEAKKTVGQ